MNPIYVAVDTQDLDQALALAHAVRGQAGGVKLGLEFFCANGPDGVRKISELGLPIFLDLKLHDIPNTVAKAVATLAPLGPSILTVHAAGGEAMLAAAKDAAPSSTKVVGVTVLTSLDGADLASAGVNGGPVEQVRRLAALARNSGIDGIVCSGSELEIVRRDWPEAFIVVPGVRPRGTDLGDQKRIVTPREAVDKGASIIVIGRPITASDDPARAIVDIAAGLTHMPA